MAEETEREESGSRRPRKLPEPLDWVRFWWKEWLSNPAIRRLTRDERGGFMDVFACTYGTETPGVMEEEDVRAWAGYSSEDWPAHREPFARCFSLTARRGKWLLKRVREDHQASVEVYLRRVEIAQRGVAGRRRAKGLATEGTTAGTTQGATLGQPKVEPAVQPRVRQILDSDSEARTRTAKTDSARRPSSESSRARAGSAGSAGSSRRAKLEGTIARALGRNPRTSAERGSA